MKTVDVLNYNQSSVFVQGIQVSYTFKPARGDGKPVVVPIPMDDLKYISSNNSIISTGILTFNEDEKPEIYKELRIHNWEEILTDEQIEDILLNPTVDGMKKLIAIDNSVYFQRVVRILHILLQYGESVTALTVNRIQQRASELRRRQRKSDIVIGEDSIPAPQKSAEELEAKIAQLEADQDAKIQAAVAAALAKLSESTSAEKPKPASKPRTAKADK